MDSPTTTHPPALETTTARAAQAVAHMRAKSTCSRRSDAGQPSKVRHPALLCCKPRHHHAHAHCIASTPPAHVRVHLLHTLAATRVAANVFAHWRWRCARRSLLTHLGYSLGWRQRCTTEFAASPTSRSAARRCRSGAPRSCFGMRLCCGGQWRAGGELLLLKLCRVGDVCRLGTQCAHPRRL